MKKFMFLIAAIVLGGLSVNATTTNQPGHLDHTTARKGYGNSFIFVENGIEFSIFPDGQFDFYMPSYGPNVNVYGPGISISFNSGYDYNPFLQYDEFGAIIQIEHVPVYYDYYGRVSQIGNVFINYNHFGYVSRIGGLYIHYNSHRRYSYYTGYINAFNPYYVYRPWHNYYRVPAYNHCVVYHKPYRKYYKPVRYNYYQPYTNNYRRTTAVASRRGNTISRRSELATRPTHANNTPRRDVGTDRPRSNSQIATQPTRGNSNTVRPREGSQVNSPRSNNQVATQPRSEANTGRPRGNSEVSTPRSINQADTKPRTSTNTVKPRKSSIENSPRTNKPVVSKPRTNKPVVSKPRTQTRGNATRPVAKNNEPNRKPKQVNSRTYSKERNKDQVASNTRGRR